MHKILFQFGSLTVGWYGLMVAAGFFVGLWNASRRALQAGLSGEQVLDMGPWLVLGAIAGARAVYVIANWSSYFAAQPWWEIFMVHHGGLVYYGGLFGAIAGGLAYVRRKRLSFWRMADVLAPGIALGHAFGRIGCLMYGCCYGRATTLPWAIHFPKDHETGGIGVHPTQVYEAILNVGLFALLARQFPRRRYPGQVFAVYLAGYAILRSGVELFRGDYATSYVWGWITPAHWFSLAILAAGLALFKWLPRPTESNLATEPKT